MNSQVINKSYRNKIHPHKFALWVAMASIIMMFAALTSAYVVRQAAGNWLEYQVPSIFYFSTVVLLCSSVTIHFSLNSFKKGREQIYKILMIVSFILGLTFIVMQFSGWQDLFEMGVPLDGNPSGSFFYVISGVHAVHVMGGLAALSVALIHAFGLKFNVSDKRLNRFELVVQYWHFVDILWLYLFLFILFTH
jgi:cytochrome c oxidase subunit 3